MKRYVVLLAVLLSFLFAQTAAANLVQNGGFETDTDVPFTDWTMTGYWGDPGYSSEWAQVAGPGIQYSQVPVHGGSQAAQVGPHGQLGYISQDLATTPGISYNVSFWLYNLASIPGFYPDMHNQVTVSWGGTLLYDSSVNGDLLAFPYTEFNFITPIASADQTTVTFGFRNDYTWFGVDDISVTAVPLPGTLMLLGSGLVGLAGLGRRKFRKS